MTPTLCQYFFNYLVNGALTYTFHPKQVNSRLNLKWNEIKHDKESDKFDEELKAIKLL